MVTQSKADFVFRNGTHSQCVCSAIETLKFVERIYVPFLSRSFWDGRGLGSKIGPRRGPVN